MMPMIASASGEAKKMNKTLPALAAMLLLSACAQTPLGPTVQVIPGQGKSFEAFQIDQSGCMQYAPRWWPARRSGRTPMVSARRCSAPRSAPGWARRREAATAPAWGRRAVPLSAPASAPPARRAPSPASRASTDNAYVGCMTAKGNQYNPPQPIVVQPAPYVSATRPVHEASLSLPLPLPLLRASDRRYSPLTLFAAQQRQE